MTLIDSAFLLFQLSPYSSDWPIAADWLLDNGCDDLTAAAIRSVTYIPAHHYSEINYDMRWASGRSPMSEDGRCASNGGGMTQINTDPYRHKCGSITGSVDPDYLLGVYVRISEELPHRRIIPPLSVSENGLASSVPTNRPLSW